MPHSRRRALILCGVYIIAAIVVGVGAGFLSTSHPDDAATPTPSTSVAPVGSR